MKRFVEGDDRKQVALLPECVDDYIGQENPVRIVDVFVDELDLTTLGFNGTTPAITGRPSYHPSVMLKIYIYGYLNRCCYSARDACGILFAGRRARGLVKEATQHSSADIQTPSDADPGADPDADRILMYRLRPPGSQVA
jgi:hypothetical protein